MNRRDAIRHLTATGAAPALAAGGQVRSIVLGQSAAFSGPEGLKRAGRNPTRESSITALESIRNATFGGFKVNLSPKQPVASRVVDLSMLTDDGRVRR